MFSIGEMIPDMTKTQRFDNGSYSNYRLNDIKNKIRYRPMDIVLLGSTGAGKSSTLNALLENEFATVGYGVDPETNSINEYSLNAYVRLWDTPGLGDTPENDRIYIDAIRKLLKKTYFASRIEKTVYLIDMVLLLFNGSNRDIGTIESILNKILGYIDAYRVLLVINQADMAMKGRHWNNGEPDETLKEFLEAQADSFQRRIFESTGQQMRKPLFYSATNKFNLYSLMDYIIDNFVWEPCTIKR
jgi:predicted GTPase